MPSPRATARCGARDRVQSWSSQKTRVVSTRTSCESRDSNPDAVRHKNLNLACLPVPPLSRAHSLSHALALGDLAAMTHDEERRAEHRGARRVGAQLRELTRALAAECAQLAQQRAALRGVPQERRVRDELAEERRRVGGLAGELRLDRL